MLSLFWYWSPDMKKYFSASSMREADRRAIEELGIPGIVLMENAGAGAARVLVSEFPLARKILILCGPGNNGGDGFVAARHLAACGLEPTVIAACRAEKYKGDAAIAMKSVAPLAIPLLYSEDITDKELCGHVISADVVVDAVLGTGSNGSPRGEAARMIKMCQCMPHVLSLDVPSGVDPDTGEICGPVVSAEATATFLAPKSGLVVAPGSLHAGRVIEVGIGVSPYDVLYDDEKLTAYDGGDAAYLAPIIEKDAHKGTRGGLLIVGGSLHFRGAPLLAARAALRAGCGFVFLAVPDFMASDVTAMLPEAIVLPVSCDDGFMSADSLIDAIAPFAEKYSVAVVGPGLGRGGRTRDIVENFCKNWHLPLLMDADALWHLAETDADIVSGDFVVTPHNGEAARLLGAKADDVAARRMASCEELAGKYGTALLKGPNTLVFGPVCDETERRVVTEGGPELSVPGSGDVLSGVIGAYMAMGLSGIDAATLGVIVHGVAGRSSGRLNGLLASEIADGIRTGESEYVL